MGFTRVQSLKQHLLNKNFVSYMCKASTKITVKHGPLYKKKRLKKENIFITTFYYK